MKIAKCDKCNKITKNDNYYYVIHMMGIAKVGANVTYKEKDLCEGCFQEIIEKINNKE